ncbi:hypothetical protein [Streptomyces glaucescens]|uniref:Putative membrane protein n=1 Tax=Streptomyces glaucescens TaxID=1907 RepID=A0A089XHS4_STRGA|nr:hypothetical protein [Streptomyces glaucescens]AIS01462.1 putative membrane protein [Streptomyces glaucescens]
MTAGKRARRVAVAGFESRPQRAGHRRLVLEPLDGGRRSAAAPPRTSRPRSMAGYLLMPRPKDAVKGLLMPFTFGLAVAAGAEVTAHTAVRALIVWAALELLVYPARYQWNDIRGFVADQHHPAQRDRGRLPGPVERARARVTASLTVALARLALVAALALTLPGLHLTGTLAAVTAAVFGVAIVYEALRAKGTGRTSTIPPPPRPALIALWVVVGAGYVVRGMTGLALAVDLGRHPATAVSAAVALWAFGIAFVTSRWVLESLAFAASEHGRLTWTARAGQAREHLLALVRWLPQRLTAASPADWAPLRGRTSPAAPWNLALLVAGTAAALTGSLLVMPGSAGHALVAAAVGAVTTAAVILLPWRRPVIVAAGAAVQLLVPAVTGQPRPWAALLPWLCVMAAHLSFSSRSLSTMGVLPGRLRSLAAVPFAALARVVVGQTTWDVIREDRRGPR